MSLPHRLIIDGVEQCASDDKKEFLRMVYLYLGDLEEETDEYLDIVGRALNQVLNEVEDE